jgi:hypothetical protein
MLRHWYYRVSGYLTLVFMLPLIACLAFCEITTNDNIRSILNWTVSILMMPIIIGTIGLMWLCPYLASADDRVVFKDSPRTILYGLYLSVWAASAASVVIGVLLAFGLTHWFGIQTNSRWSLSVEQITGIAAVLVGCITALPNFYISKKLKPRMMAMTRRRLICFECGYDLRGTAEATSCPECGSTLRSLNDEQTTAHPGQGPADHDRA